MIRRGDDEDYQPYQGKPLWHFLTLAFARNAAGTVACLCENAELGGERISSTG